MQWQYAPVAPIKQSGIKFCTNYYLFEDRLTAYSISTYLSYYTINNPLARKYLAIPASSVTSERAFKVAKFASKYRFRLKAVNLERILFLSYNLEALGHPLLHEIKTPPPDFQKPNGPLNFKFTHFQSDMRQCSRRWHFRPS